LISAGKISGSLISAGKTMAGVWFWRGKMARKNGGKFILAGKCSTFCDVYEKRRFFFLRFFSRKYCEKVDTWKSLIFVKQTLRNYVEAGRERYYFDLQFWKQQMMSRVLHTWAVWPETLWKSDQNVTKITLKIIKKYLKFQIWALFENILA
jgi:hypothetical protein